MECIKVLNVLRVQAFNRTTVECKWIPDYKFKSIRVNLLIELQ